MQFACDARLTIIKGMVFIATTDAFLNRIPYSNYHAPAGNSNVLPLCGTSAVYKEFRCPNPTSSHLNGR